MLGSAAAGNMTATATPANGTNLGAAGTGSVAYDGQPGMPLPTIVTLTAP